MFSVVMLLSGIGVGVRVSPWASYARTSPLWGDVGATALSHCSISDRCLLEYIIETQLGVSGLWNFRGQAA